MAREQEFIASHKEMLEWLRQFRKGDFGFENAALDAVITRAEEAQEGVIKMQAKIARLKEQSDKGMKLLRDIMQGGKKSGR